MSFTKFLYDDPLITREQAMKVLIQVADELNMPDKKGACIVAGMTVSQEVGVEDGDAPFERRFWCPANPADAESFNYDHDSESDDGRSVGYFQQQKGPKGELWWGTTQSEMDLHSAATQFMTRLKKVGYNASNATAANDSAQSVQQSGVPWAYAQWWNDINQLYAKVAGTAPVAVPEGRFFEEINLIDGSGSQSRNGKKPRLIVLHTEEGNMAGQALDQWMDRNNVSYHYIIGDDNRAWDLVDTDRASWSVLDANNFCINYVFAPSYAGWTRQQWLDNMGTGIKICAYLVAQDCLKYNIEPVIRVGNSATGYASLANSSGITDHYGITKGLGIGTHTDVGGGFPWDVFNTYLQKYIAGDTEDDMFTDTDRAMVQRIFFELTNKWESRSIYRDPGEGPVDTLVGMLLNDDGMEHGELIERLAVLGDSDSIRRVRRSAAGKGAVTDKATVARAKKVFQSIPEEIMAAYKEEVGE
ncbi:endolysin [Mycobacterium phage Aziz]|uniref:Lysin A n=1 Tax=Mycobacterium phage Aziz TaxID=2762281 RepID=A0A7G8LHH8_9CAUD|nr:endolysin [Mycobacterium phage Aziz]ASR75887.1 lysin A [Mycobacterium phage GenevaB15]QNJ56700.1 lysin A [Mycobacterium phage Aziz]